MAVPNVAEKWSAKTNVVTLGGGRRSTKVTVGGTGALPFLRFEGDTGRKAVIAGEVWDSGADELWPAELKARYGRDLADPAKMAKRVVDAGAKLVALKLQGTHPDFGNRSDADAVKAVESVLAAVGVPLIVWGCDVPDKDNVVMPKVAHAAAGENCLLGVATEKNYRTLAAVCTAEGHKLIAESPLDINICKQLNILLSEAGFPLENIVMHPTTGGLGYGMEYNYSILERGRTAALGGDKLLQPPVILNIGFEAWRAKEAKAADAEMPGFGPAAERGAVWETLTATNLMQAGGDILVMRHPEAMKAVNAAIDRLYPKGA